MFLIRSRTRASSAWKCYVNTYVISRCTHMVVIYVESTNQCLQKIHGWAQRGRKTDASICPTPMLRLSSRSGPSPGTSLLHVGCFLAIYQHPALVQRLTWRMATIRGACGACLEMSQSVSGWWGRAGSTHHPRDDDHWPHWAAGKIVQRTCCSRDSCHLHTGTIADDSQVQGQVGETERVPNQGEGEPRWPEMYSGRVRASLMLTESLTTMATTSSTWRKATTGKSRSETSASRHWRNSWQPSRRRKLVEDSPGPKLPLATGKEFWDSVTISGHQSLRTAKCQGGWPYLILRYLKRGGGHHNQTKATTWTTTRLQGTTSTTISATEVDAPAFTSTIWGDKFTDAPATWTIRSRADTGSKIDAN